jgi:hypothetical protein
MVPRGALKNYRKVITYAHGGIQPIYPMLNFSDFLEILFLVLSKPKYIGKF